MAPADPAPAAAGTAASRRGAGCRSSRSPRSSSVPSWSRPRSRPPAPSVVDPVLDATRLPLVTRPTPSPPPGTARAAPPCRRRASPTSPSCWPTTPTAAPSPRSPSTTRRASRRRPRSTVPANGRARLAGLVRAAGRMGRRHRRGPRRPRGGGPRGHRSARLRQRPVHHRGRRPLVRALGLHAPRRQGVPHLFNPFPDSASVNISLRHQHGPAHAPALRALSVPGGSVRVVDVGEVITNRSEIAGHRGRPLRPDRGGPRPDLRRLRRSRHRRGRGPSPRAAQGAWSPPRPCRCGRPAGCSRRPGSSPGVRTQIAIYNPGARSAEVDVAIGYQEPERYPEVEPIGLTIRPRQAADRRPDRPRPARRHRPLDRRPLARRRARRGRAPVVLRRARLPVRRERHRRQPRRRHGLAGDPGRRQQPAHHHGAGPQPRRHRHPGRGVRALRRRPQRADLGGRFWCPAAIAGRSTSKAPGPPPRSSSDAGKPVVVSSSLALRCRGWASRCSRRSRSPRPWWRFPRSASQTGPMLQVAIVVVLGAAAAGWRGGSSAAPPRSPSAARRGRCPSW